MTLDDLGDLSDFLGAIAVLVTLVYLAIQVRQSSALTRVQTRQSVADSQILICAPFCSKNIFW